MPPPYPSSCAGKPRPGDYSAPAAKRPTAASLAAVATAPTKKIARPASEPNLVALHAASRPRPPPPSAARAPSSASSPADNDLVTPPPSAAAPHQPPAPAKNAGLSRGQLQPVPSAARPQPPATPAVALPRGPAAAPACKKPAPRPAEPEFMAPRGAKTVHPARRLAPGTFVSVRTRFQMITDKCWLVIWLPARVVSASGAYHYTIKYSADLSPAHAGKMVRKPVDHVRVVALQRAAVKAEPRNMAPA